MTDDKEAEMWDEATVRECAKRVFDCQLLDLHNENQAMRIACANQALFAYDNLMRMIDPDRSLSVSVAELRGMSKQ